MRFFTVKIFNPGELTMPTIVEYLESEESLLRVISKAEKLLALGCRIEITEQSI